MSLLLEIKAAQLAARKNKFSSVSILTTLMSEAEMIGKNDGNRQTSDAEVVAVIQKFIKNINEVLRLTKPGDAAHQTATFELSVISDYLPSQLTEEDIRAEIQIMRDVFKDDPAGPKSWNVGAIMTYFKANFPGRYDGKALSSIAKETYDAAVAAARSA